MKKLLKRCLFAAVERMGYVLTSRQLNNDPYYDATEFEKQLLDSVSPFTMTCHDSVLALVRAVEYVHSTCIDGAIVECGVWRGGSMMAVAKTLLELATTRDLYLFDTFSGMPDGGKHDINWKGESAEDRKRANGSEWAYASFEDVRCNMQGTKYPEKRIQYVKGLVEATIPERAPKSIAILRLDTDFYESTYHELTHLYPRLATGGVLIIDDYGHWAGARQAVDQYFRENNINAYLFRVNASVRCMTKQ